LPQSREVVQHCSVAAVSCIHPCLALFRGSSDARRGRACSSSFGVVTATNPCMQSSKRRLAIRRRSAATSCLPPRPILFVPSYNKYPSSYSFEIEVKCLSNHISYNTPPGSGVPLFCPPQPKPSDPEGTGRTSLPPTVLTWPSAGAACFRNMNMGFRPSLSNCLNNINGLSFSPKQRSWSPCTM
jgi:hypothetical protein